MGNAAKNDEIVRKFLASKIIDFAALGNFVAENGSSFASASEGEFGFIVGNRCVRYCIPPATQLVEGVNPTQVRTEVTGR
jgi:hypothetical protein